jgi:Xaa-Pro aminopeptidase
VPNANYERRLAETRALLADSRLDALLVASQYNRRYLTGFSATDGDITESSGLTLVTADNLFLITGTFHLTNLEHEIVPSGAELLPTDKTTAAMVVAAAVRDRGIRRLGFEKDWFSYARFERLREKLGESAELVPADDLVEKVRVRKDTTEIAAIRRAAAVADSAFAQLVTELRPGMTERQIAQRLDDLGRQMGSSEPSFPTIVGAGPGGALPHWVPSDREVRPGEPLLIDFGCRVDGYCSDLTRTICLGEPDPKLVEVYAVVRAAQDAGEQALASGMRRGRDVDLAARKPVEDAGYGEQYLHSLGHGVGMAVHELPHIASPRTDDPAAEAELARTETIQPENVVTIEPGIYLPGWGGVRLEDLAVVHEQGLELLAGRNPEHVIQVPI